eukprot:3767144-Amphidinium_carterae.1
MFGTGESTRSDSVSSLQLRPEGEELLLDVVPRGAVNTLPGTTGVAIMGHTGRKPDPEKHEGRCWLSHSGSEDMLGSI